MQVMETAQGSGGEVKQAKTPHRSKLDLPEGVRCRPVKSFWIAGMLLIVTISPLIVTISPLVVTFAGDLATFNSAVLAVRAMLAAVVAVPAGLLVLWAVSARVVADERGVKWRGLVTRRFAAWSDVADYYDRALDGVHKAFVIETAAGRLECSDKTWDGVDGLRAIVALRATAARPDTVQYLGNRSDLDLPMTFSYDTTAIKLWCLALGVAAVLVGLQLFSGIETIRHPRGGDGPPEMSAIVAILETASLIVLCGLLAPSAVVWLRSVRRCFQRIVADTEGLRREGGGREDLVLYWDDIVSYGVENDSSFRFLDVPVFAVHGAAEPIVFDGRLRDKAVLQAIVAKRARNASTKEW